MLPDKVTFHFKSLIIDALPEDIRAKVCIAGGCIRDKIMDQEIKDIDLFVQDLDTEEKLIKFFTENGKVGNLNTQLANFTYEGRWIQVIRGKYYDMKTTECIDSFDFTLCMAMITVEGLKVGPHFYEALAAKHIRVNKLLFPLNSFERLQKYIKKGYTACNGTLLELTKGIQTVNLNNNSENALEFYSDGSPRFMGVD